MLQTLADDLEARLARVPRVILAIDGQSASGKTTLANALAAHFSGAVFHMDDFFLPPERRTPERLAEPGGNMDRERFLSEVLEPLKAGKPVLYRAFSCQSASFLPTRRIEPTRVAIVEGAYCLHPCFGAPYDETVFLGIAPDLQRARVLERNGARAQAFFDRWIPLEERYLQVYGIRDTVDRVLMAEPGARVSEQPARSAP